MFLFLFLGHVLIVLASNVEMLYGGRILCGLCQGFCNCLTIVYVLEFCHNVKEMAICGVVLALIGKPPTDLGSLIRYFTVWKFRHFLSLWFCVKSDFRKSKIAIFNFGGFEIWLLQIISTWNVKNSQKFKIQSCSNDPNGSLWGFQLPY